jgi:hypothetical protein
MNEYINKEGATIYYTVYWWCKLQNPEKTTDLSQVTDTISHNVVSSTPHQE